MKTSLAVLSAMILALLVTLTVVSSLAQLEPTVYFYRFAYPADLAGYVALILIAASGLMMLFRRQILGRWKSSEAVRLVHVLVAGAGGAFMSFHIVVFVLFPLTLPVLFGLLATYLTLGVWVTGLLFFEGLRNSIYYHGLLSLVGVSLIVLHVFTAERGVPVVVAGGVLLVVASVVLGIAVRRLLQLAGTTSRVRPTHV